MRLLLEITGNSLRVRNQKEINFPQKNSFRVKKCWNPQVKLNFLQRVYDRKCCVHILETNFTQF